MTINMCHARRFLFLTALLLKAVISEGSYYLHSCSIDERSATVITTTGEANVPFEHPVRYVVTPDQELRDGFDLSQETDWSGIMPLVILLGKGTDNKQSDIALHSAIGRMGEVIESRVDRSIPEILSPPDQKGEMYVDTIAAVNYIFQDTFYPVDERVNDVLIDDPRVRVSLHDNDIKHSFGDIWAMAQPSLDITRLVGFFVVYLDQGVYLLIHEHGFKFLDLAGFRKLVEVTPVYINYAWQSGKLALKPITWSQWLHTLSGYIPSASNLLKWLSDPVKDTVLIASLSGLYAIKKFYSSSADSGKAPAGHRRRPGVKNPKDRGNDYLKPKEGRAGYRKTSCEEVCLSPDAPQCQAGLNAGLQQLNRDQALRSQAFTALNITDDDRRKARELQQRHQQFAFERVTRLLQNHLRWSGWTVEELIRVLVSENRNRKLMGKLQWAFNGAATIPNELMGLKKELDKGR